MSSKSWHLDRRSFLRGAGVSCALPYLEAMELDVKALDAKEPKRACFVYFPNGCSLPDESDEKNAHWRWFPKGEGKDFEFTKILEPLTPFKDQTAVYGGLSHPRSRELLGHLAGDTWLTGGDLRGGLYKNSISVDQLAARHLKKHTRYDEETIREWYAGFLQVLGWTKVILHLGTAIKGSACIFVGTWVRSQRSR